MFAQCPEVVVVVAVVVDVAVVSVVAVVVVAVVAVVVAVVVVAVVAVAVSKFPSCYRMKAKRYQAQSLSVFCVWVQTRFKSCY